MVGTFVVPYKVESLRMLELSESPQGAISLRPSGVGVNSQGATSFRLELVDLDVESHGVTLIRVLSDGGVMTV